MSVTEPADLSQQETENMALSRPLCVEKPGLGRPRFDNLVDIVGARMLTCCSPAFRMYGRNCKEIDRIDLEQSCAANWSHRSWHENQSLYLV